MAELGEMYSSNSKHPSEESLRKGIAVSVGVHIAIVLFFTVKAIFFTAPEIDFSQAVRVDLVGLPQKLDPNMPLTPAAPDQKESAPPQEKPTTEATPEVPKKEELPKKEAAIKESPTKTVAEKSAVAKAEPDSIKVEQNKKKQSSAISKLKALEALEKIEQEQKIENAKKLSGNGIGKSGGPIIRGNVISPGTALTGLSKMQHDAYISQLDQHIKSNWTLPEWLANKDYKAQVRVFIDSRGVLIQKQLAKSSGNPTYDDYALLTIDKSSPFPVPPEKFTAILEVQGFLVRFPD